MCLSFFWAGVWPLAVSWMGDEMAVVSGMKTGGVEIGRVLRSSTTGFAVGCRVNQLSVPSFGSLIKAEPNGREVIYGIIYNMHIDDDQLIQRLVMTENPRPEIIEDQRQNRMLPVEMSVLTLGYGREVAGELVMCCALPPRPPLNLDPVFLCDDTDELCAFTDELTYLRLIMNAPSNQIPIDQLLVAHVQDVVARRGEDRAWALTAVGEIIELLRNNYDVLMPTLEALSGTLPELQALESVAGF